MHRVELRRHAGEAVPFHVALQRWRPEWDAPLHVHDAIELVYVVAGSGTHAIDQRPHATVAGDLCVIPVGATHQVLHPRGLRLYNLLLDPGLFTRAERADLSEVDGLDDFVFASGTGRRRSFAPPYAQRLADGFARLEDEATARRPGWRLAAKASLVGLLLDACRLPRRDGAAGAGDERIDRALRRLHRDPAARHTVAGQARRAGLTADHFGALFQRRTGVPFHAYLRRLRVGRAQALLERTGRTVTAIALHCGFADGAHCTRAFVREAGMTPRAYRVRCRG